MRNDSLLLAEDVEQRTAKAVNKIAAKKDLKAVEKPLEAELLQLSISRCY